MEKLRTTSPDLTEANIDKLAELFPTVVTETLDGEGNPQRAVDFDLLRQELSDHIVDGPQERYRLDWPGKRAAAFAADAPIAKTLRPVREESVDFDTTKNLFIEGDNLDALKLLQESYLGKVKLIYIDPPYNTGNDFVYQDDFAESSAEYLERSGQKSESGDRLVANPESNGRFHSDWLSMMYPRLKMGRNLLTDNGVLIAAIDDNEYADLKLMLDEIMGANNFIASVVWRGGRKNDSRYVSVGHDYMLIYARNEPNLVANGVRWREKKDAIDEIIAAGKQAWANGGGDAEKAQGLFREWWRALPDNHPAQASSHYNRIEDTTGRPVKTPTSGWRLQEPRMIEEIAKGRIFFGDDERKVPTYKRYLDETDSQVAESVFYKDRRAANKELQKLMGRNVFDFPKDVHVLARWFTLVTSGDPDAIVLDFFAGSGSTAHAVMEMNAADGGRRKFVLVQLPEETPKSEFPNIASAARERIRRAASTIGSRDGLVDSGLDLGFRSLRVDSSNRADVLRGADDTEQLELGALEPSVVAGRTGGDLLFQVLLDWGLELSLSITRDDVDGHEVFVVDDGALIACFTESVTPDVVRAIAKRGPLRAVFRDDAFGSDAARINAEQIFRELSPSTEVKAI